MKCQKKHREKRAVEMKIQHKPGETRTAITKRQEETKGSENSRHDSSKEIREARAVDMKRREKLGEGRADKLGRNENWWCN